MDREQLLEQGIRYLIDESGLRRLWIPTPLCWAKAKSKRDLEKFIDDALISFGLSPDRHVERTSAPGGTWFEQDAIDGIREANAAAVEEIMDDATVEDCIAELGKKLGLKTLTGFRSLAIACENVQVNDRKAAGYGPQNIANTGITGVIVRANDKVSRLYNLITKLGRDEINESIEDNLLDLSNYGIIGLLLRRGMWPSVAEEREFAEKQEL